MRGKGTHKGKLRKYTAPDEIDRQMGRPREKTGDSESDEEDVDQDKNTATESATKAKSKTKKGIKPPQVGDNNDDQEEEDDEAELGSGKSTDPIIESCNPNHIHGTAVERPNRKEAAAAARAVMDPLKLKSEAELASDLARLQLVRKEREQAALRREQERQAQEARRAAAARRAEAKLLEVRQKSKPGAQKRNKDLSNARTASSNNNSTTKPNLDEAPSKAADEVPAQTTTTTTAAATADQEG